MRFFCAVLAMVSNACLWSDVDPGFAQKIDWGWFQGFIYAPFRVDVFFMISGFLLFYLYNDLLSEKKVLTSVLKFYYIRLARIYPLHALILYGILGIELFGLWRGEIYNSGLYPHRVQIPGSIMANFTLTQAWGFHEMKTSWNGPAWSLSAEWFNYLLFPFILMFLRFFKSKFQNLCLIAALVLSLGFLFSSYSSLNLQIDYGLGALVRSLTGFLIGSSLCKLYFLKMKAEDEPWDWVFSITLMLYALILCVNYETLKVSVTTFYVALPILMYSLIQSKSFIRNFLSRKFIIYLGKLAFAIYMVHQPLLQLIGYLYQDYFKKIVLLDNQWLLYLNLIGVVLLTLIVSDLLYRLVENPMRNLIKKKVFKFL